VAVIVDAIAPSASFQPLAANVRSKALAGSDLSGVIAPRRTISGNRLFGIKPSSANTKVSVPSGAL